MTTGKLTCCKECGEPLISTFLIPGCEWYCAKCKRFGEFFGFGIIYREETPQLLARYEAIDAAYEKAVTSSIERTEKIAAVRGLDFDSIVVEVPA